MRGKEGELMRAFDYKCMKCETWTEAYIETERVPERIYCACGGIAQRRWRKAPGLSGTAQGAFRSDQLNMNFSSRAAFKRYLKKRNLEVLAPGEELKEKSEEQTEKELDRKLTSALEESWQRVIIGKQSVPQMEPIEVSDGIEV